MAGITEIAPAEMAELTKDFIAKKNVNDRVGIRLRMKAILDYLSTDTEFPPNPLLKKDERATPARDGAFGVAPVVQPFVGGNNIGFANGPVYPIPATEPIPGAPRMDNADILG